MIPEAMLNHMMWMVLARREQAREFFQDHINAVDFVLYHMRDDAYWSNRTIAEGVVERMMEKGLLPAVTELP